MEACTNPDVLKVIFFIWEILKILFIVVPIGLIIMIGVDFFKNVTASKDDNMKKNLQLVIKRLIYCVAMFFVPTIINIVNYVVGVALEDTKINYTECLTNANSEKIKSLIDSQAQTAYEKALNEKTMSSILKAEEAINKKSDDSTKESMQKELSTLKEEILSGKRQEQSDIDKANNSSNGGTSSGGTEHLDSGTQGTYFAPVQGVTGYFGSTGSTDGCANYVSHDLSGVASGTPIYAGIDGKAEFLQTYSTQVVSGKTVLTSYGNQVRITASDGTTIRYAHLLKFADGIETPITESCPKKNGSPPCPGKVYPGNTDQVTTKMVKKGDLIGYLGDTGNSTGPHLHVEIHEKGGRNCVKDPWSAFGMK